MEEIILSLLRDTKDIEVFLPSLVAYYHEKIEETD